MQTQEPAEDTAALSGDVDIRAVGSLVLVVAIGICIAIGYVTLQRSLTVSAEVRLAAQAASRVQALETWHAALRAQLAGEVLGFIGRTTPAALDNDALVRHVQAATGQPSLLLDGDGTLLAARVPPYSAGAGESPVLKEVLGACAARGQALDACLFPDSDGIWVTTTLPVAGKPHQLLTRVSLGALEATFAATGAGDLAAYLLAPADGEAAVLVPTANTSSAWVTSQSLARQVIQGEAGTARIKGPESPVIAVWRPMQSLPWGVVVTADVGQVQAPSRQFLLLGLLVLVLAVPATYLLLAALSRTTR